MQLVITFLWSFIYNLKYENERTKKKKRNKTILKTKPANKYSNFPNQNGSGDILSQAFIIDI